MSNENYPKYDELCYATFANIRYLTDGESRIVLRKFDWNNKEHQFVVAIISACYDLLGHRPLAIDVGPLTRGTIRRKFQSFSRIGKPRADEEKCVNVPEMLDFMRNRAIELCGENFSFGDIYDAYYSGKEI